VEENGPTTPFHSDRMSAFAYLDPGEETAIFVTGLPDFEQSGEVQASWCDGYPSPAVTIGDVITLIASQRPIATLEVTSTTTRKRAATRTRMSPSSAAR
jgi:hypothetical protein